MKFPQVGLQQPHAGSLSSPKNELCETQKVLKSFLDGHLKPESGEDCGPPSPVTVRLAENWESQKMNLRMSTKMFANYNLCFITLHKMSVLKSFLS